MTRFSHKLAPTTIGSLFIKNGISAIDCINAESLANQDCKYLMCETQTNESIYSLVDGR
jgi:hypothetical protein